MNLYEGTQIGTGLKAALVVSRFNSLITSQLEAGALDALRRHGVKDADLDLFRCPGTFELPALLARVAGSGRYDLVVALGAVLRGGTPHFDYIASEVAKGVFQVSLDLDVPVAFGVLTCDSLEQALERSGAKGGNKGFEAAAAAVESADLRSRLAASAPR